MMAYNIETILKPCIYPHGKGPLCHQKKGRSNVNVAFFLVPPPKKKYIKRERVTVNAKISPARLSETQNNGVLLLLN